MMMKQTLRNIFLLLALFMATTNAWAECYVLNESQIKAPYEKNNSNESGTYSPEYSIDGPCAIMTFSYRLNADVNATYWHRFFIQGLNNSGQWIDLFDSGKIYNAGSSTITKDISAYANQISKLRVKRTAKKGVTSWDAGTKDVLVNNIKITRLTSISPESASHTFGPITVGESTPTYDFTFDYSNVGTNFVVSSKKSSSHFSIEYIGDAPNACEGSAKYRVTYNPQFGGSHDEIYTITCKDGDAVKGTVTISVIGNAKGNPLHTWWSEDIYYVDDAIDLDDIWDSNNEEFNTITYSIPEKDGFVPSGENNEGAIKPYIDADNKLYLGHAGTLHLVMHQIATDGFYEKTSTKTITINKYDVEASISLSTAVWNEIIDNPFSLSYGLTDFDVESKNTNIAEYHKDTKKIQTYFTDGTAYFQITRPEDYKYNKFDQTLSLEVKAAGGCNVLATEKDKEYAVGYHADPKEYWFDLEGVGDVLTVELKKQGNSYGYIHIVGYDENGGNETNLGSFKHSEISTDWGDVKTCTILKNEIRKIQIKSGGNIVDDALNKYFRNLKVTRKTFLDPQVEDDKLYLSQSSTDMTYIGIFNLNWSTCADEIRLSCDNPMFVVTPSVIKTSGEGSTQVLVTANAQNAANLTGNLTVYDQTQKETIILSCEQLLQRIEWNQYFGNLESTEEGYINETFELNAVAKTVTGNLTNQPITYNLNSIYPAGNASLSTENGKTYLHITGKCEGTITASVEGFTKDGKTYSSDAITHDIRVRKAGEPCNTVYYLKDRIELNTIETSEPIYVGDKNPDKLRFIAHRDITAANYFYVVYSTNGGSAWTDLANPMLPAETDTQYEYTLPDNTTHVRFETRTGATWKKYVKNIEVTQKAYLNVEPISISEIIYVNTPFSKEITVQYSDIPLIQSELTKNTTDNLYLYPHQSVNNNCGQYGEYTFTLLGEWEEPQTIQETIRFFTSAGDEKLINIKIDVITNTQITSQADGDWNNPSSWSPNIIPTASHPVIIKHTMEVSSPAEAYGVVMTQGAHINIHSTGGLTVHAGGYTPLNKNEEDLEITINNDHAGYFRTKTDMPKAIVHFTTRGQLNGGNQDAAWQYIGAPGSGVGMDLAHTTVLYLRSEEKGWVRQYTEWAQLTPFAGYALTQKEQETFTLYPQLLNENITISLTYTENGMEGDNLWANSYMAPLDITKFTDADFTGDIDKTFYLYNSGSWNQWNEDKGAINSAEVQPGRYYAIPVASARALDATYDQNVVPPMQGVYMKANSGGGTITLNYEKHVWNNTQTAQMNQPLRVAGKESEAYAQSLDFQRVRLQVNSENSGADRMYIIQDSMATAGYDNGYDAPKLMADGLMNIYTNEPFGKMEISSTDHMNGMYIGFQAGEDTHYIMTFTSLIGDSLYLYDLEEDKFIEMQDGEQYHFSAMAQSTNDMRFQLLVAPTLPDETPGQGGGVTTDVENITTPQLWISDRKVFVSNAKPNSTMAIYTASGMLITAPCTLHTTPYTLDLSYLPTGVYVLRLNDQAYKFVCK